MSSRPRHLPMTHLEQATQTDFETVVDTLRGRDRFLVVTHENPDGDALGSMLATTLGLRKLGKDVEMYLTGTAPLPGEYSFLDVACANERRIGEEATGVDGAQLVVNVDHHHDNSNFGGVNLIDAEASST